MATVELRRNPLTIAAAVALIELLIQLATNGQYGYFRDELYFMACGDHLDWGYADHAPMVALISYISRLLFGDSLHAIRFFPALAGAGTVFLTGLIARELGGGRFAVFLACLTTLCAAGYLRLFNFLSMNAFEPLFWMGCAYTAALAIHRDNPKLWLWTGLIAGLGIENKHSMLFFAAALIAGLLLTPERRLLASKWIWLATALAFALWLPNLLWEQQHNWATLELLANVKRTHKNVELGPLSFIGQQILLMLPPTVLVWGAGLAFLLLAKDARPFRALGYTYLVILAIMIGLKGKNYYLLPAYPMLLAAGGVFWERFTARQARWLRIAIPLVIAASGLALAPLVLPVLPIEAFLKYQDTIGIRPPKIEVAHQGPLPQYFGDMFGWPELVETVASIYNRLPADQRAKTGILAGNYGEAGAIDFFGPRYGLPKAISAHQNYWFWGPRQYTGESLIVLQHSREDLEGVCGTVEQAGTVGHPYAMGEEHFPIFICRGLKQPLAERWPRMKHWN